MQQVMIRIADPVKSLDFYCKVLGMNLIWHADFPQWKFSLYFVGYCDAAAIPARQDSAEDFCRLKVQRYTAHGLVLIPAYCFARP